MSEYKENTVGWWLSQLKEPLKSRIVDTEEHSSKPCESLEGAISSYLNCLIENSMGWVFWKGVYVYFFGGFHIDSQNFKDGFNLAHECDPWREDKAIVDSPEKPKNWIDQELWKWHTDMVKGGVEYADAERGKVKLVADSPAPIAFEWNDNSVIDFTTWNLKRIKLYEHRFEIENQDILDSFKRGDAPELWHQPEYPFGYTPPAPEIPVTGAMIEDFGKRVNYHPAREIEAPERAVVGYEEPKPIDTIEKKHELRIKNLEARVMQLEGVVGKLEQQIEYVYRNLPKDFDGTR